MNGTTETLKQAAREPLTRAECERAALFAKVLVEAALANKYVRLYVRDPGPVPWTEERVRRSPPVRVEFEHAYVLGEIGESLAAARGKCTFGAFVGVLPVEKWDPVGEMNVMYVFKDTSPYNRRVEQRRWMKKRLEGLGKGFRQLVTIAMDASKRDFVAFRTGWCKDFQGGAAAAAQAIRLAFGSDVDLGRFWRMARGKEIVELPTPPVQGELFDAADDEDDELVRVKPEGAAPRRTLRSLPVIPADAPPKRVQRSLFDEPEAA
jgi:hypothetical protein